MENQNNHQGNNNYKLDKQDNEILEQISNMLGMENQNNRQENNHQGGIINKIGQTIENVVDAVTGDNQNNGQQRDRNNNNNR